MKLSFTFEIPAYKDYLPMLKRAAKVALKHLNKTHCSVSVYLCGDGEIQRLNREFRCKDMPTDVLSFESGEDVFLGDIAISVEKAISQAEEYGHSIQREMCFLLIHGILHLSGFDHIEPTDEAAMRTTSREIFCKLEV